MSLIIGIELKTTEIRIRKFWPVDLTFFYKDPSETRTKVDHKNVSQGCN